MTLSVKPLVPIVPEILMPNDLQQLIRRYGPPLRRAAHDPTNIKIAAAAALGAVVAAIVFMPASATKPSKVMNAAVEEKCGNQTWPYIDQRCADAMKAAAAQDKPKALGEVRVVKPEPAPQLGEPAIAEAKSEAVAAEQKPLPAQTVAAAPGIGADKDAFTPAAVIETPAPAITAATPPPEAKAEAPREAASSAKAEAIGDARRDSRTVATAGGEAAESRVDVSAPGAEANASLPAETPKAERPKRSKTARTERKTASTGSDYNAGPNTIVKERIFRTEDGRTFVERKVYRNVTPEELKDARRPAGYSRTFFSD